MIKLFFRYFIPAALLAGMLCSCENDIKEVEELSGGERMPVEEGENVDVLYSQKASITFRLKAPKMLRFNGEESYNEMPDGVDVEIYDSLMNVTTHLTAKYAIDRTYDRSMEARNDVVVVNQKGEQLNTEELRWDKKTGKITSDVFVKITTADEIIMGDGLEANQDFSVYKIKKIRGTINIKEEETP